MYDVQLQPEEPAAGPWHAGTHEELLADLLAGTSLDGRPAIVAVDGRSGAGKSTLADALARVGEADILHTDDFAWHEPMFEWAPLLRGALTELRRTGALDYTPPAWVERGRTGSVVVPPGARLVVVEGVGSSQRAVADLIDAAVWVQSDDAEAERRGIARDIADGVNGDEQASTAFWFEWIAEERPFLAADRPWERADAIVAGTPVAEAPPGALAWSRGRLAGT